MRRGVGEKEKEGERSEFGARADCARRSELPAGSTS